MRAYSEKEVADRFWRMQNLYLIRDKDRKLRKLRFNPNQVHLADVARACLLAGKPIRDMDLKARQVGASTFWLIYYLDDTVFTPNTITFIVAQKQETLGLLWDAVALAYAKMPEQVRPKANEDNARTLAFGATNSTVKVSLSVKSTAVHNLLVSEYAYCDPDEIEQTLAAVPPTANVTLETVPDGVNHAYDKWDETDDGYTKTLLPWFRQSEYRLPVGVVVEPTAEEVAFIERTKRDFNVDIDKEQLEFRRKTRKALKRRYHEQFVEDDVTCFLASGLSYFDGAKVKVLLQESKDHPPVRGDDEWAVWEERQHKHHYAIGADVAEGVGGDYSVMAVICLTCKRVAARYKAHCGVDSFYRTLHDTGMLYNKALLGWELNNHGHAIALGLRQGDEERAGYPNLYKRISVRPGQKRTGKELIKYGWETTVDSKPLALDNFKHALEGDSEEDAENFQPAILWQDPELLKETLSIREQGGKISAVAGKHDDIVMAYAIAWQMCLYELKRSSGSLKGVVVGSTLESA